MPSTLKIPPFMIRAAFVPGTINPEKRTVDVCFASEAPVRRPTWDGVVHEILSFDTNHVRMDRINSGAPLLDNHNRWGKLKDSQLGVVERAWVEGRKGYATVRFSKREDVEPIFQDVLDGIIRNVSVGYNVFTYEKTVKEDGPDVYRAIDWEPAEISFTPIPADVNAGTRSANDGKPESYFQTVNILNHRNMEDETTVTTPPNGGGGEGEQSRSQNPPVPPSTPPTPPTVEGQGATRSANPPVPPSGDVNEAVRLALQAERQRSADIRSACEIAGIPGTFADALIQRGASVEEARAAIFTEMAKDTTRIQGRNAAMTGPDETDRRRTAMVDAILHRCGVISELPEPAQQYRAMSLVALSRAALEANGINTRGRTDTEVARMVFNTRAGMISTSDFPEILGNTINRTLRSAYELAPRTFMPFCRRTTNRDFRAKTVVQLSQLVKGFDEIPEGGEYTFDKLKESKESYSVKKFGKKIAITWETLINDDLDAFSRIPQAIANQAAQKQNDIVWAILTGSTTMGDNVALFHTATHGNLASSGGAINNATLGAARAAMRKQKDLNGKDYINVMPSFLLVGPDKETEAEAVIHGITYPTADSEVNVWKHKLKIIVEPRITGNTWYLAAMPSMIDTIEYAFLEGEQELFTEQQQGFDVDGIIIKARMVFGAKAIDWKGFYKNPGA